LPGTDLSACLPVIIVVYPALIAVCVLLVFLHVAKHFKPVFKIFRKSNMGMYIQKKPPRKNPGCLVMCLF